MEQYEFDGFQDFACQRRRRGCPCGVDISPFPAPTSYEFGLTTKSGKVGVSVNIHNDKVDTDTAALQHQETPAVEREPRFHFWELG